ncbi:NAD(P)-dependent alcohol dehydrogenase [Muriicola soli]|uniref:NAD(P)-dependent alcohol dehydrogenase n=1 Tax=Muriicola soli TaxID=2507538 RepID=A0A411E6R7_9FLAO|nr:NAD(P)-dependent alcohol dehydrogenase [Muriicola soli]QBA63395.1 NAD(P)-dependent alcohol dehydrogenase [Muriicola soli]
MKAFIYRKYGPPDVLQLEEIPRPVPSSREILIKVIATSVNRTDCANLRAKPAIMRLSMGLFKPKNPILGTEFSGEVIETGEQVTAHKPGDKVFGFADFGLRSHAEYLLLQPSIAFDKVPKRINMQQAAGCIEGMHYAYNIINKISLNPGDQVLVNGATGGIGTAALQLLHHMGMKITAVCNTDNIELALSLGAIEVIDWQKEDFTQSDKTYHAVLDVAGKSTFGQCRHLIRPGGAYISSELGPWSQNVGYSLLTAIFKSVPFTKGRKVKFPYPPNIMTSIRLLVGLIEEGHFTPVIDRIYPFEQIPEAFGYVEKGHKTGNVIISLT